MLSLSNASLLLPPALSGAEGEAEGYSKTIWRPAAPTLPKREQDRHPRSSSGANSPSQSCGISPTKRTVSPALRTSMYVHISIDKMFHVEHFSILSAVSQFFRKLLVQRRRALRTGLPTAVHPQPLVGIAAHVVFNNFRKQCGIRDHVGIIVAGADQINGRIETKPVLS
jgi:hypothetical protein